MSTTTALKHAKRARNADSLEEMGYNVACAIDELVEAIRELEERLKRLESKLR